MLLKAVASRYADALFSLAEKAGGLEKVEQDLALVDEALEEHSGLRHSLVSPTVANTKKHSIVEKVFSGRISDTMLRFLYVLIDKKREEYVSTILSVFRERLREERGEVECHVKTATALTATLRKDLEKSLKSFTGKKVQLTEEVSPDLLAGMVVLVGDKVIDTSFRHQLSEIASKLSRVE